MRVLHTCGAALRKHWCRHHYNHFPSHAPGSGASNSAGTFAATTSRTGAGNIAGTVTFACNNPLAMMQAALNRITFTSEWRDTGNGNTLLHVLQQAQASYNWVSVTACTYSCATCALCTVMGVHHRPNYKKNRQGNAVGGQKATTKKAKRHTWNNCSEQFFYLVRQKVILDGTCSRSDCASPKMKTRKYCLVCAWSLLVSVVSDWKAVMVKVCRKQCCSAKREAGAH